MTYEGSGMAGTYGSCSRRTRRWGGVPPRKQTGENGRTGFSDWLRSENEVKMSHALEKIAKEIGAKSIRAVAIAYVMQKVPHVFPIIGGRKVEHLLSNVEALEIALEPEHIAEIEGVFPFDVGFPHNFIVSFLCPQKNV